MLEILVFIYNQDININKYLWTVIENKYLCIMNDYQRLAKCISSAGSPSPDSPGIWYVGVEGRERSALRSPSPQAPGQ